MCRLGLTRAVAFYNGQEVEKNIIERAYFSLTHHINRIYGLRFQCALDASPGSR